MFMALETHLLISLVLGWKKKRWCCVRERKLNADLIASMVLGSSATSESDNLPLNLLNLQLFRLDFPAFGKHV